MTTVFAPIRMIGDQVAAFVAGRQGQNMPNPNLLSLEGVVFQFGKLDAQILVHAVPFSMAWQLQL